jgi:urease gamma subunit
LAEDVCQIGINGVTQAPFSTFTTHTVSRSHFQAGITVKIPEVVSILSLVMYEIMVECRTLNSCMAVSNAVTSLLNVDGDDR